MIGVRVCAARGIVGIMEVERFAAIEIAREVIPLMNRICNRAVGVIGCIASVGQRRIIIDADRIDVVGRPERIERETH